MKKEYSSLIMELLFLAYEDVITTSPSDDDLISDDIFKEGGK